MSGKVIAAAIGFAVGAIFAFWIQYRIRQANRGHGYDGLPPLLPPPPPPVPPQHPPVARRSNQTRTRKRPKKVDNCVICLQPLNNVEKLPCGHTFHSVCIQLWLKEGQECPYRCNKKVVKVS